GLLGLRALVHALEMTAIGSDGTHAFVVVGKCARDRQLATTAFVGRFARGRGVLRCRLAAGALLRGCLFFLVVDGLAAMSGVGMCCNGSRGFFLFESAGRFFFGVTLGEFVGGLARIFFGLALFGGGAFDGQARFFDGAMLGFFFGAAARDLLFFGELAQHHAARNLLVALALLLADLRLADFRLLRLWRFGGFGHFARCQARALLLHHHSLAAAMAEALFDGRRFRLFQRQRLAPLRASLACRV